jgi:hypothetical protein
MKSNLLLLIALISCLLITRSTNTIAQDLEGTPVCLSAGGMSVLGVSLNAEFRAFNTLKRTAFVMGGLGTYKFGREATYKLVSLGLNAVRGNGNHHSELGAALTYNSGGETKGTNIANESLFLIGAAGYRYQRPEGGVLFRIYYAPILKLKEWGDTTRFTAGVTFIPLNLGLCLGYSF